MSHAETNPDPFFPQSYRVRQNKRESYCAVTLYLEPINGDRVMEFKPGQFNMMYAHANGEVPISICGRAEGPTLLHTVNEVGPVSRALGRMEPGSIVGLRGPYGTSWPLESIEGGDVLLVAGGIGMASLRSEIHRLGENRDRYGNICILYGARTPRDLVYGDEFDRWQHKYDMQLMLTVDSPDEHWKHAVGVVPTLVEHADFEPDRAAAMICGPEIMMRFTVEELLDQGLAPEQIYLSLERNMVCGIGLCGHCQLGTEFVCMDGPVFHYPQIAPLTRIKEL